jgi:hypothetical protein
MKKLIILGAILCGTLFTSYSFAQDACCAPQAAPEAPCDQPTGECWCLYTHYDTVCCDKWRCVEEPVCTTRKCCRQVPQYYEVQKCKYVQVPQYYTEKCCKYVSVPQYYDVQKCKYVSVPQYYTETCCKYVPEYYDVQDTKYVKKYVCDKEYKQVPKQYWKHVCNPGSGAAPAPACGPQGCGAPR